LDGFSFFVKMSPRTKLSAISVFSAVKKQTETDRLAHLFAPRHSPLALRRNNL
jgi:hypothetical protein